MTIPDEADGDFVSNEDGNNENSQWLVNNFVHGAVEESKEVDDQEEQSNSVSSSLLGDTIITPFIFIRRTDIGASSVKVALKAWLMYTINMSE